MKDERGYAMVAAVLGVAAFAFIAFEMLAVHRGAIASVGAQVENAQLRASADAGIAAAIYGLSLSDASQRWAIDGRSRSMRIGTTSLKIVVEDEHGKIPINRLNEDQVRKMFEVAGASGDRLDQLVDSFEDWQDEDDDPRPHGAEAPDYVSLGVKPRNSDLLTVDELALIKGMDKALFDKLAPALTVFYGETGAFSVQDSQPLALAVLSGAGANAPDIIERQRELAGQRPVFDTAPPVSLTGRPLTIRVLARNDDGSAYLRSVIVEFTGNNRNPYWVRFVE